MSFGYDEEAIYQDADIEMMELEAHAAEIAALRRRGICSHGYGIAGGAATMNRSRAELEADLAQTARFEGAEIDAAIACQADIAAGMMLCLECGELIRDPFAR